MYHESITVLHLGDFVAVKKGALRVVLIFMQEGESLRDHVP